MIKLTDLEPLTVVEIDSWEIAAMRRKSKPKTTIHLADDTPEHTVVWLKHVPITFKVLETPDQINALVKAEDEASRAEYEARKQEDKEE